MIATRALANVPFMLAHTRDEDVTRSFRLPARDGHVVRPKDDVAQGTWVGLSDHGFVCAITNRMGPRSAEKRPSRGQLCLAALRAASVTEAQKLVCAELAKHQYDGFNLILADRTRAVVLSQERGSLSEVELGPGIHVVTSAHHLDPDGLAHIRAELTEAARGDLERFRDKVLARLRSHEVTPLGYPVCKHMGVYGTVAASLFTLSARDTRFEFAAGPLCTHALADVDS